MKFTVNNTDTRAAVTAYIERLPQGKTYDVTVTLRRERRTVPQNALYWLWIQCIATETGGDKEQIHTELKVMFAPRRHVRGIYDDVPVPVSTTALDTAQMTQYLEAVQTFAAAEMGIVLPTPEDKAYEAFEEYYNGRL